MILRLPSVLTVPIMHGYAFLFASLSLFVAAQTPAPPVPNLTREQKEAAAAVEAPKPLSPPPIPGQIKTEAPAKPATMPVKVAVPTPPSVPESSASKIQALEAATKAPIGVAAPSVAAPVDKIPITSSTSSSRQFIVHGKVFETRSAMSSRCDEVAEELRKVLNDKEPWVLPIVVVLNMGEEATKSKGPAVATAISEMTHGGFHLQITINDRPGLNAADLRKEIVRVLLAERILRNHQKISMPDGRLLLPDWIMTGVLHALDYRASARPSAMFATIFRSGKIYGIEEIIEASPVEMDGLSHTIYETSCCALVLALVDQPEGPKHFNQFLNALSNDPRSERELLNAVFPNFAASASSLNKWWSLQLAALSKRGVAEPLSSTESLKALEEAITIHYQTLPAEAPKNVKPRPFIIPPPLQVVAAAETKHVGSKNSAASKPQETAEVEEEKTKRSLWRRLLFLGDPNVSDAKDKEEEKPKSKDQPVEKIASDMADKDTEENKPGFFGRFFGGGSEKEKKDTKKSEKTKAAAIEKPKSSESEDTKSEKPKVSKKEETETKEEKKPSALNPLNWFRGDKKPEEEKKKDDQAFADPSSPLDLARLISPSIADVWNLLAPAAPHQTAEPLFNFLRRKPKDEDKKEEELKKEETPKKAATKIAAPSKSDAKKDSKPRTSNPNAQPAAKTVTPPGASRVTNPSSKPLPPGFVPATATGVVPTAAKLDLVPVVLPLEEYQLILKRPDRAKILDFNVASLRAIELRVSILFRPVVNGYLALVLDLQQGKTKDMDKRLTALRQFALVAHQKSNAVCDYLDWFEASESGGLSGKFDDFLNLPTTIKKELPPRTDPISKYLDAIDKEFSK